MKAVKILLLVVVVIVAVYLLGPKFDKPVYSDDLPAIDINIENVEAFVKNVEAGFDIKEDNEARVIWHNDSIDQKTKFSMLYLHGFSASWYEGNPTHINLARQIGANLFLSRLKAHGLKHPDAFAEMDPAGLYESAKEALLIARELGEEVIVVGTSTGGTLALKLAADFPELVSSIVLLSPNIEINNPAAFILSGPWGLPFARYNGDGSLYRDLGEGMPVEHQYWYRRYRWEAVVYLQQLVETTMTAKTFQKVTCPVFLGYYYKDENHQDETVRVDAMLEMFDELGTPDHMKEKQAFPEAGAHVIGCADFSPSAGDVEREVLHFLTTIVLKDSE